MIVGLAGHAVASFHDLRIALSQVEPGETIPLRVRREGLLLDLTATLEPPPGVKRADEKAAGGR